MKQPERVAELLAELRALAETDFERHRIDVLERDLTAPPVVEIVDDTHQRFNGCTYNEDKVGHFAHNHFIHRDVWQYYHGDIPDEYQIHHVDENKANNAVENLQCLTKQEHRRLHNKQPLHEERVCKTCGKIFIVQKACQQRALYCSEKCQSKVKKICSLCGKEFLTTSYKPAEHCRSCTTKLMWENRRAQGLSRQKRCPICGKSFVVKPGHEKTQCCSRSCGHKLQWQTRKLQKDTSPSLFETT